MPAYASTQNARLKHQCRHDRQTEQNIFCHAIDAVNKCGRGRRQRVMTLFAIATEAPRAAMLRCYLSRRAGAPSLAASAAIPPYFFWHFERVASTSARSLRCCSAIAFALPLMPCYAAEKKFAAMSCFAERWRKRAPRSEIAPPFADAAALRCSSAKMSLFARQHYARQMLLRPRRSKTIIQNSVAASSFMLFLLRAPRRYTPSQIQTTRAPPLRPRCYFT